MLKTLWDEKQIKQTFQVEDVLNGPFNFAKAALKQKQLDSRATDNSGVMCVHAVLKRGGGFF